MRAHPLENEAASLAIGHDAAACKKRSLEASWRSNGGDSMRIAASVQAEANPVDRADTPRSTLSPIHDQSSHTTIGSPSRLFARR